MRSIVIDPAEISKKYVLQVNQGGTGADNQEDAVANLGGLWAGSVNKPGGVVGLDQNKLIPKSLLPDNVALGVPVNLHGPQNLELNAEGIVTITNFDSFTTYTINYVGCTGYRQDDKIYVRVGTRVGAYIEVNGSVFALDPFGNRPLQPDILGGVLELTQQPATGRRGFGSAISLLEGGGVIVASPQSNKTGIPQVGLVDLVVNRSVQRSFDPPTEVSGLDGNTLFGTLTDSSNYLNRDTLIVGVKTAKITNRSRVMVYQNFQEPNPVSTFFDAPDNYGIIASLALSRDTRFIAAGYPDFQQSKGAVAIYQKGAVGYNYLTAVRDITGLNANGFGSSLALSLDGTRMVVASKNLAELIIFGVGTITAETHRIVLPTGYSQVSNVIISENGTKIAFGAVNATGAGAVLIYYLVNNQWALKATIAQPTELSNTAGFGKVISASKDFSVLAIGAPGSSTLIGRVYLVFNGTSSFDHYKTLGEAESVINDGFGSALSMDPDGHYLWVGAPRNNTSGRAYLYGGIFDYLS